MFPWRWILVACAAGAGLALLAPAAWPVGGTFLAEGPEGLRLEVTGETAPVVRARIAVTKGGAPFDPGLQAVRLHLRLPDGRAMRVPVLRWDGTALVAERRPPRDAALALGLLGLVVVLWITEAIPLFVTSLLVPCVLAGAKALPAARALAPFFDPVIVLFFGGFLMAEAMKRVGLDRRIALLIVAKAARSPAMLLAALLGVSAFLSMWMSNTATTALLVPIAIAITKPIGHPGYRKAAVLGIAYAATIGGVGSLIGTPANPIAQKFLRDFAGKDITFAGWFAVGLPLVLLFLPVMGIYLWKTGRVAVDRATFLLTRVRARDELADLGPATRAEWSVLAVFAGTIALWLTQRFHGINTGIVALMGAVTLALIGKVKASDLGEISWEALLTFGGGLCLGSFLVESGTSDSIAAGLGGLAGLPPFVAVAAVAAVSLGLTTVASNTATAAMLVPLSIPLAGVLGLDPMLLVCVVAVATSIDFALVIGTPPTMIAYATGLFTAREIFKKGIALDVAGIVILVTAVAWIWQALGITG